MNLVKVISTKIKEGQRLIKFLRYGKSDVQECLQGSSFGDDSNAPKDMIAIYSESGEIGEPVIIGYINKNQLTDIGEKRIYSLKSNGDLSQYVWLKNDGTMEVGGDIDNMVRYSKLETAFNRLKQDFNNLVTAYNSHTHVTTATIGASATPGVIAPTTSSGTSSTADITPAKITEIKTM